jgi:hypothetical protein
MNLAVDVIVATKLPASHNLADKLLSLIRSSAESWQSEGLLVPGPNNTLVKSPIFQLMWDGTKSPEEDPPTKV